MLRTISRVSALRSASALSRMTIAANLPSMARFYAASDFPKHTIIDMPALSPTMTQGNVGAWQKKVGDELAPGEVLVEIETDKATMDFEFQDEGYLAKVLLDTGSKDVPVGKPIGVFVDNAEDVAAFESFTLDDVAGLSAPAETKAEPRAEAKDEPKVETPAAASAPAASAPATTSSVDSRIKASPLAKAIALEQGIPLKDIKGSGPGGRIIKKDVENYKPAAVASTASASTPAASSSQYTDTPISAMRKTIAARLTQSKQTNPDYFVSSIVSVSKLLKLRAALNASADGRYKLSVNDLLIKAVAIANGEVPQVNSAWLEAEGVVRTYNSVDVSVAVATPTGLITPVVRDARRKGLSEISKEIKALGAKAREGKLKPEEYQGGTVTISNLGMNAAVTQFSAIINPPQSAIVAIGTTERRAIEDPEAASGIAFDDVMTVTASFDHKVVDGAVGGEWVKALKRVIENPLELML